jgi:hypothetical protein
MQRLGLFTELKTEFEYVLQTHAKLFGSQIIKVGSLQTHSPDADAPVVPIKPAQA